MSQAYAILDELIIGGEMCEPKQRSVVEAIKGVENFELEEELRRNLLGEP
jgi:hypothetical protein